MSKIDRDLAGALRTAVKLDRTKAMNFVLVIKEAGWGTMIVSKKKIENKEIDQAKKELGANKVLKGRCSGDGKGQLIFETAKEPDAALTKTLKTVITQDAGMTLKFEARKAGDLTDDDDDKVATKATPKDDDKAKQKEALLNRLKALAPDIARALAGPNATAVRAQLKTVKDLIDQEKFPEASKALDELEKLLGQDPLEVDNRASSPQYCYEMGRSDGQERSQTYRVKIRPEEKECLKAYDEGYAEGLQLPAKVKARREQWHPLINGEWTGDTNFTAPQSGSMMRFRLKNLSDQEANFWITPNMGVPDFAKVIIPPKGTVLVNFALDAPKAGDWKFDISTKHQGGSSVLRVQWELFHSNPVP